MSESDISVGPLGTGGHSGPPFPAPLLSQEPLGRDVNREVCALTFTVNLPCIGRRSRRWWVVPDSRGHGAASLRSGAVSPGRGVWGLRALPPQPRRLGLPVLAGLPLLAVPMNQLPGENEHFSEVRQHSPKRL